MAFDLCRWVDKPLALRARGFISTTDLGLGSSIGAIDLQAVVYIYHRVKSLCHCICSLEQRSCYFIGKDLERCL